MQTNIYIPGKLTPMEILDTMTEEDKEIMTTYMLDTSKGQLVGAALIKDEAYHCLSVVYKQGDTCQCWNMHPLRKEIAYVHDVDSQRIHESLKDSMKSMERLIEMIS